MGSPTPASSSTSTTPVGAQAYTPQFQPQADQAYYNLLTTLENQYSGGPGTQVRDLIGKYLTGFGQPGGLPYGAAGALAGAQDAASQYASLAPLFGTVDPLALQRMGNQYPGLLAKAGGTAARQLSQSRTPLLQMAAQTRNAAFDPQSALYRQQLTEAQQQAAAAAAAGGLAGTPYGASTTADAVNQFNLNWQNNLLNRQIAGGQAAGADIQAANAAAQAAQAARSSGLLGAEQVRQAAYGGAQGLAQASDQAQAALSGLPYQTGAQIGSNAVQAQAAEMAMPAQLLGALESYLGLGRLAALASGQLGQMGFNQQAQGLAGLIGGANAIAGPYGLLSSGGVGPLSGLFGGGAGVAGGGADFVGGGIPAVAAAGGGGLTDFLGGAAPVLPVAAGT